MAQAAMGSSGGSSTDSGLGSLSGGTFGNVNIGGRAGASGVSLDQTSVIVVGVVVAVVAVVLLKKWR